MTVTEQIITILIVILATQLTRWLPFLVFRSARHTPAYVHYLGKVLPPAIFGMLMVYCYKDTDFASPEQFLPEVICGILVAVLQLWQKNICLSIVAGTAAYVMWVN